MDWLLNHPVRTFLAFALIQIPSAIAAWLGLVDRWATGITLGDWVLWIPAIGSPLSIGVLAWLLLGLKQVTERIEGLESRATPLNRFGRPYLRMEGGSMITEDDDGTISSLGA